MSRNLSAKDLRYLFSDRRARKIMNSSDETPRVFIPQWRMRQIRWEESAPNAAAKRFKKKTGAEYKLRHFSCSCGSKECIATPVPMRIKS